MAIHAKDLEVKFVDDVKKLSIDPTSLSKNLEKYAQESAYQYYQAVIKPTREEEKQLAGLGKCRLYIKQDPNLVKIKKVALMRKPKMVVECRQFRMQDGYAGVFICDNDGGNQILRDMEPPEHDKWDKDRYKNKEEGGKILREMHGWVKEILREMANTGSGNPEEIDGLDKYLPYEDDAEMSGGSLICDPQKMLLQMNHQPKLALRRMKNMMRLTILCRNQQLLLKGRVRQRTCKNQRRR